MKQARKKITKRVISKTKSKQPSGAANRKRRREIVAERARAAGVVPLPSGELIPMIGALQTASDWHNELGDLYRRARCGMLDQSSATKLAWICSEAAKLSRGIEELKELASLRAQLEKLNGGTLQTMHADHDHQTIEG